MSKTYDFLKECGAFFVLTINENYPAGRPFGAVMEHGDNLYLATNDLNHAHQQLRSHAPMQIVAKKPTSREWIRITGLAEECSDADLRQKMIESNPVLKQRFDPIGYEHFLMFKIIIQNTEYY